MHLLGQNSQAEKLKYVFKPEINADGDGRYQSQ